MSMARCRARSDRTCTRSSRSRPRSRRPDHSHAPELILRPPAAKTMWTGRPRRAGGGKDHDRPLGGEEDDERDDELAPFEPPAEQDPRAEDEPRVDRRRPRPSRGATRTEGQPWRPAATQRWAPGGAGACPGASATAAGIGKAPGRSPGAAWAYRSWPASAPPASWRPASAPRPLSSPSSSSCGALYNSDGNVVNESHAERGDGRAGRPCAVGGASAQTLDAASQQALGETLRLLREPALRDAAIATNP